MTDRDLALLLPPGWPKLWARVAATQADWLIASLPDNRWAIAARDLLRVALAKADRRLAGLASDRFAMLAASLPEADDLCKIATSAALAADRLATDRY